MKDSLANIIILTGHYGTGKTNFAVNLATDLAKNGEPLTVIDLDIVNPYFRTADFSEVAKEHNFTLLAPPYANSNLDMPVLTAEVDAAIASGKRLIIDVGGDDAGATALGRYAGLLAEREYSLLYVISQYRYLTQSPEQAVSFLRDIERASRLEATHVVNNSNLAGETTLQHVIDSLPFAEEVAQLLGLPLLTTAIDESLYGALDDTTGFYPVKRYVKLPWDRKE